MTGTIIGDQQDDRAFHFTLYQRPPGGLQGIRYSVLDGGYLVFVREQNRRTDTDWTNIALNQKLAKLMYKNSQCTPHLEAGEVPPACLYRENTYLIIEVNSAPSALKQDRQEMLYSALKTSFDGQNPPIFSSDPQALQKALATLADNMAQSDRASAASAALAKVENDKRSKAERLAASENFGVIWFEKAEDGQPVAFPADEVNRLLERVSLQLARCGASANELSSIMESVRSRDPGPQNGAKKNLIDKLVCSGP